METLISLLFGKLGGALAAGLGLLMTFLAGRSAGKRAEQNKSMRQTIDAVKQREKSDETINRLGDRALDDWMRDHGDFRP